MKEKFLLNPDIYFLNHGSFGACPKEVFEVYQNYQKQLEFQPVEFLIRQSTSLLQKVRVALADFLKAKNENLAFIVNTTFGVNSVVDSLDLRPGDEVLTSDLEYGACDRAWIFKSKEKGFVYKKISIGLPVNENQQIIDLFRKNINENTKVIFLSHITSSTALILPVKEICELAHKYDIITVIDGAHAPGQLDLNLEELNTDVYIGNCHKWLLSPKGAAFIYANAKIQELLKPSVISWGNLWEFPNKNNFIADFEMQGTRDYSSILSVPAAINFWKNYVEPNNFKFAKNEVEIANNNLTEILRTKPITDNLNFFRFMYAHPLPAHIDPVGFKAILYDKYHIEIPITRQVSMNLIRLSFQIYNSESDYQFLYKTLKELV